MLIAAALIALAIAPMRLRLAAFDDFDHITIGQSRAQRHVPAIDLGPDTRKPKIGVHRKGEINRSRPFGQLEQRAFGRR